jgi:hypothetical protein
MFSSVFQWSLKLPMQARPDVALATQDSIRIRMSASDARQFPGTLPGSAHRGSVRPKVLDFAAHSGGKPGARV